MEKEKTDNNYKLVSLSHQLICKVYNERMVEDFPSDELKPLDMILKLIDKGRYYCYGLFESDEIVGYTFLNSLEGHKDFLIDYLATCPDRRNEGLGTVLLKLLSEELVEADSVIGEVENPQYAIDNETAELQNRRYNFYMRNGFRDTKVRARCFGVPFIIIELGCGIAKSEDEIKDLYKQHYASMLPKHLFADNVIV